MAHTTRVIRKVMQMNQCPDCGRTAMNFAAKLVGTSLSCQHCQAKLRLRLAPTAGLAIFVLVAILFAGMNFGVNGASFLFAICCLVAFLVACLLMPLEVINKDQES
jgi:hypothetical protein